MNTPHDKWIDSQYYIRCFGVPQDGYHCNSSIAALKLYEQISETYINRKNYPKKSKYFPSKPDRDRLYQQIWNTYESIWADIQKGERIWIPLILKFRKTEALPGTQLNGEAELCE